MTIEFQYQSPNPISWRSRKHRKTVSTPTNVIDAGGGALDVATETRALTLIATRTEFSNIY
jgi:hypothetical protein